MENDTAKRITEIITSIVEQIDMKPIEPDADLQQMGMDSISFIRIIVSIEDEFKIEFPDDYLLIENMNTINKIINNVIVLQQECGIDY